MSDLEALQAEVLRLEKLVARRDYPERGRVLHTKGVATMGTTTDYTDNNNHTPFSITNIFIPAGGMLEAHLTTDFHMLRLAAGITCHTIRLEASTLPDVIGDTNNANLFRCCTNWASTRTTTHHMIRGIYSVDTTITLNMSVQNWDSSISALRVYSGWNRLYWMVSL